MKHTHLHSHDNAEDVHGRVDVVNTVLEEATVQGTSALGADAARPHARTHAPRRSHDVRAIGTAHDGARHLHRVPREYVAARLELHLGARPVRFARLRGRGSCKRAWQRSRRGRSSGKAAAFAGQRAADLGQQAQVGELLRSQRAIEVAIQRRRGGERRRARRRLGAQLTRKRPVCQASLEGG
jgi:hypothetical protein